MKKYVFESLKFFCAAILCTILTAFATPARAALPSGYTELQYIESTGTQYIDTGYAYRSANHMAVVKFSHVNPGSGDFPYWVWGSDQGGDGGARSGALALQSGGKLGIGIGSAAVGSTSYTISNPDNPTTVSIQTKDNNTFSVSVDGRAVYTNVAFAGNCFGSVTETLFGVATTSSVSRLTSTQMYSVQFYDNGTLVRNFVPAKDSSGKIGMYDTVNNRFYTNAGTGSFIAGPDACNGTIVNYVSATGTGVQNGTPTPTNPIEPTFYKQGDMVLRKVGDIADSYDASTGKITRRVGVLTLTGTENISMFDGNTYPTTYTVPAPNKLEGDAGLPISNSFAKVNATGIMNIPANKIGASATVGNNIVWINMPGTIADFKSWLAAQYAAGTPVMVYYPLKTATTEDWTESQYCNVNEPIKIATTKYNETAFGPLNTALANAISVVDTVVSNTITQAASIATLQAQKQTRPNDIADDNEKCPAGKKCLLVEDASGVPHWYEIVERYSLLPDGYTELQWIESTGTQYIDTGVTGPARWVGAAQSTSVSDKSQCILGADYVNNSAYSASVYLASQIGSSGVVWRLGSALSTVATTDYAEYDVNFAETSFSGTINGESLSVSGVSGFTNWYIGMDRGASSIYYFIGKIYTQKAYQNDTLVRDMIPAKDAGGVIGMYDTVNNRFYTNAGTGSFIAGDPVAE